MATWLTKISSSCIITFVLSLQLSGLTSGAYFTKKPPFLQYVLEGNNATFNWEYNVSIGNSLLFGQWKKVGSSTNCITKVTTGTPTISCPNYALEGQAMLILKNVTKAMDGDYECDLAFSNSASLSNSTALRVVSKIPTFVSPKSNVTIIEDSNNTVITIEAAGDYLPTITWYKNNAPVDTTLYPTSSKQITNSRNSDLMVQGNLTILSPKRDINNNEFVTKATYGLHSPTSNTSIKIIIWYGPESLSISSSKSGMGVSDGQSVTVTCTAVSNPPSTFTFLHNNSVILKNSATGILIISSFSRNDTGNYSCMAANEVSNATIDGVWFLYVEPITTTSATTTQKPTSIATNGTTDQSNSPPSSTTIATPKPGETTDSSSDLPTYAWVLIIFGGLLFLILLALLVVYVVRRKRASKEAQRKSPMRLEQQEFDISNYIKATSYPNGYENHVEASVDEPRDATTEISVDNPHPEEAKTNLGMKFESEHDLIEHMQRPGKFEDVDFKDYDPFEEDDIDRIEYHDPYAEESDDPLAFDNDTFQEDDITKVRSSSDREIDNEPELFTDLGEDIVQYDI